MNKRAEETTSLLRAGSAALGLLELYWAWTIRTCCRDCAAGLAQGRLTLTLKLDEIVKKGRGIWSRTASTCVSHHGAQQKAQLFNLLRLLNDPKNDIYIHIDKKAQGFTEAEMRAAAPDCRVAFVPRLDARWGSEVFIDAMVSLVALASREEHVFYHLLSGVDLPLKSQREIHAFFEAHAGEEFVSFERETAKPYVIEGRIARAIRWQRPVQPLLKSWIEGFSPA
ncbi:MAG: beta-1,6-N-acetylglucosaminyltransferase [Eubacteriales bacterium]